MEMDIVWLWNDAMNRNGSKGNLLCLRRRLQWRDISVRVRELHVGEAVELEGCDLLYLGAGIPYENVELLSAAAEASPALRGYVEKGGVFLAVCEGMELMGQEIVLHNGDTIPGVGVADFTTRYAAERTAGNLAFQFGEERMVAFENHAGRVELSPSVQPLGRVLFGKGNGTDGSAGVRYRNFFGCSAYSLLPLNPALTDAILLAALAGKYEGAALPPLRDEPEDLARQKMLHRLIKEA